MNFRHVVPFDVTGQIAAKRFLTSLGVSGSRWKSIKHSGTFCVNGQAAIAAQTMLIGGDEISYSLPDPVQSFAAEDLPLNILFEDNYFIIVNKPPHTLVHPVRQEQTGTVGNAVLGYYMKSGQTFAFHPVHRLDRDTSGALLIAKTPEAQHLMSTKDGKRFFRQYLAIVSGKPSPPIQIIDAPIARVDGVRHAVRDDGKPARTHLETIATANGISLLRLKLDTGRTHQIRVHLAHIGTPLLGDTLYGEAFGGVPRQMLHAEQISFVHPFLGEQICITAPMPEDMRKLWRSILQ